MLAILLEPHGNQKAKTYSGYIKIMRKKFNHNATESHQTTRKQEKRGTERK